MRGFIACMANSPNYGMATLLLLFGGRYGIKSLLYITLMTFYFPDRHMTLVS